MQHLSWKHLPISGIFQLLLTWFSWNFKGSFLKPYLTDADYQVDICPCNICQGDICPYQEYLSCYSPDFDETLNVGSWEHLEQILNPILNPIMNPILNPNIEPQYWTQYWTQYWNQYWTQYSTQYSTQYLTQYWNEYWIQYSTEYWTNYLTKYWKTLYKPNIKTQQRTQYWTK